ncbi:hypothetical protein LJR129_004132 [Acidovorax sp. LjRoot129]|uniref:hypothetical protein n=1 Tax=Acidovorax sp. LjRoot129 TaxID=3342260 RepID=UPI003ECFE22D
MSVTVDELCRRHGNQKILDFFERRYPSSYQSFLDTVHACMDRATVEVQRAAQYLYSADEDTITTFIVSNLRAQQLDAEHDSDSGGHVDVFIQDADKKFTWAAEAKIDSSADWVQGSIPQLMDRYADGTVGADQGGILIYIKNEDAANYMLQWRNHVVTKYSGIAKFRDWNCSTRHPYSFFSECVYNKTGQLFGIRHIGLTLFRQASKDDADAKAAAKKHLDESRKEAERLASAAAIDAAVLAKSLEDLAATRHSDADLQAAAGKARAIAERVEEAAKAATGALPPKKRARSTAVKHVK